MKSAGWMEFLLGRKDLDFREYFYDGEKIQGLHQFCPEGVGT